MLKIKKEELGNSKIKLDVKIPSEMMRTYFAKSYNKLAPEVQVKGFRKGMAPKHLIIEAIGEGHLMQEIINLALSETYVQALKQEKITPIAAPKVNVKMLKDLLNENAELEYEAEIDVLPEVKIGDYKKVTLKKEKEESKITDEEIEHVLSHLQREHATFEEKDGPSEIGDRVEIDFEGKEKGVVLENLTSKNYPVVLGSKVLIPEFEKEVVGMKKGEEKEFETILGKEKKKINFKVKVHDVKKVILPPLDDTLAQKYQKPTIDELKKAITLDILQQKEIGKKQQEEGQIVEQLLKLSEVEIPESLVDQEIHRMIDELRSRSAMIGMPFETYLAQIKKTEEDLHKDFHEQAEKTVKVGLILGEIAKKEKMDLKDQTLGRKVMDKLLGYAKK